MFFEGGGYKSRAGCHGARTVPTSQSNLNKSSAQILVWQILVQNFPNTFNLIGEICISTNHELEVQNLLQS